MAKETKPSKSKGKSSEYKGKSEAELIDIIEKMTIENANKVAELEKSIEEKDNVITELLEANVSLKSTPASADLDETTVEVDGVKYAIRKKRFIHGGITYSNNDVATNSELAAKLVKSNSPILARI